MGDERPSNALPGIQFQQSGLTTRHPVRNLFLSIIVRILGVISRNIVSLFHVIARECPLYLPYVSNDTASDSWN